MSRSSLGRNAPRPVRRPVAIILAVLASASLLVGAACAAVPASFAAPPAYATGVDPEAWALVPAGEYLAGQFNERARTDRDFEIMVTPVTNAQYARYLNEALAAGKVRVDGGRVLGHYPGDPFAGKKHEKPIKAGAWPFYVFSDPAARITFDGKAFTVKSGYEDHPVTMVTWFGARAFAESHGWRLPTEAEWEKAARGVDGRPFPWGDAIGPGNANYYHSRDPFETPGRMGDTTPVGLYGGKSYGGFKTVDSKSPYGLYDMAGNVDEWTADVYAGTHQRYLRGGNKGDYPPDLRSWARSSAPPDFAGPSAGFRCARDPVR